MDLSTIPGDQVQGLDRNQVENDRKKFWEKFFEKHEQLGAEDTTSVAITEIDKPELVEENLRGIKRKNLELPVSKTLNKWVKEHEDEIDELTTLAGPPSVDEEEISEEDDEESDGLEDLIDDKENTPPHVDEDNIPPHVKEYLPSSPPSSPHRSLLDPSDSDSELLLYAPSLPTSKRSIFAPLSISENLNFVEKLTFSPKLSSSRNNSFALSEAALNLTLNCSLCQKGTNYSTKLGLDEAEFKCDTCMIEDHHPECSEDCENCKRIAAELDARWIHRKNMEGVSGEGIITDHDEKQQVEKEGEIINESLGRGAKSEEEMLKSN